MDQAATSSSVTVSSGQSQYGFTVSGQVTDYVLSGGKAVNTSVFGQQYVFSGGVAGETTVEVDGELTDHGSAISATVLVGGDMVVGAGGVAFGTVLSGYMYGSGAGLAQHTEDYGGEFMSAGAVGLGTQDHGDEVVFGGGFAASATVFDGAYLNVASGGVATDITASSGGQEAVLRGGFLSGGTVDSGAVLSVSGFAAAIYVSGIAEVVGGTTSGTHVIGTETVSGSGGVSGEAISSLISAGGSQVIDSGGIDSATVVLSGGSESVEEGGVADSVAIESGGVQFVFGEVKQGIAGGVSSDTVVQSGGLLVELGTSPLNTISADLIGINLQQGGTLELATIAYAASDTVSFDQTTEVLTVSGGGSSTAIQLSGDHYTHQFFEISSGVQFGGVDITVSGVPCYCRGTRVLTTAGEVAVEALRIGDVLVTRSGPLALRWVGRRGYDGRFAAGNRDLLPVTFRAGSLGGGLPLRDLSVSPLHAMFLDGVLIPAVALVNGRGIVQAEAVAEVEYFHLELERHAVIYAEGAESESYLEDGNRAMFHNAGEHAVLYPEAPRLAAGYCAPRVEDGPVLEAARRRLAGPVAAACCRGFLDGVRRDRIVGWAVDEVDPARRVAVRILDRGVVIGAARANLPRADLRAAGLGDGAHGFELVIAGGLSPLEAHYITAETEDGTRLDGDCVLDPAAPDAALPHRVRGAVDLVSRDRILGWAFDDLDPMLAVEVQIVVDGVLAGSVMANRYRRDVADAGLGDGRHAFEHHFAPRLTPAARHAVEARCALTGVTLGHAVLESADAFDGALERAVGEAVAGVAGPEDARRVLDFLEAQADRLRQNRAEAEAGLVARAAAAHRRVAQPLPRALVIDHEWPDATRDAGSQAVLSHMRALREQGYEVSFVASRQLEEAPPAGLAAMGVRACAAPFYASVEEVLRRQAHGFDLIYLHRAGNAARYTSLARDHHPRARIVYSVADLHHVRLARQAAAQDRPELMLQSARMRLVECTAAWQADVTLTHSEVEAAELRRLVPSADVRVVPWVVEVAPRAVLAGRVGIGFVGNYGHEPNVDAARHLVERIMPLVWRALPEARCCLVGSAMPEVVRGLAGPGVEVLGQVPDLAGVLGGLRLTVAPLRFGAGLKGKVLDSLAAGVPCVASVVAAEGLDVVGVEGDAALAAEVVRLHDSGAAAWRRASDAGRAYVAGRFNAGVVAAAMACLAPEGADARVSVG